MRGPLATRYAPSFRLVGAHVALGVAGFVAFSLALAWRATGLDGFFFQSHLLGLTHLCVLGWLLPITLGALHQLVPVLFEVPVRSERVAWIALAAYATGATGFVARFWSLSTDAVFLASAGLLVLSVYVYIGNLLATLVRTRTRTLTGAFVVASFVWLLVAAGLGLALAANLYAPYLRTDHLQLLRAHAHAAGLGFFGMLVMGVAFRLLEMFLLAHVERETSGWVALVATNLALVALVARFAAGAPELVRAFGLLAALVGVAAFLRQVALIFRVRLRRRIDVAWRHTAASFAYLVLALLVGCALALARLDEASEARLRIAYAVLALPGFIGSVIVGQLYKILPFLVWLHRFSPYVGLKKVRPASELLADAPQRAQWASMHAGIAALLVGILAGVPTLRVAGAVTLALSSMLFARNMSVIYRSEP
jgi:hypothetical protein